MRSTRTICLIVALAITMVFAYTCYTLSTEVQGTLGYVSDETWYVTSSRNLLRDVFGIQPSPLDNNGTYHYTIFFYSYSARDEAKSNFTDFIKNTLDGSIFYEYNKTSAFAIKTLKEMDNKTTYETFRGIRLVQKGYLYPDAENIDSYLNTEHPPLVKYLLGLTMLTLGDTPLSWRIPGIVMGSFAMIFIYLIASKLIRNDILALVVFIMPFTDPVYRSMSSIAMLDIYAAFFIAMSAWLALRGNYTLSAIAIGLATSSKLTGVFCAGAILVYMLARKQVIIKSLLTSILIPFSVWLTSNLPLIAKWGFQKWFELFQNGLKWLSTSRPPGPPTSTPWGWFYNENAFALNFNPNVYASVNIAIYLMALIMLIFIPYLYYKINTGFLVPALWFAFPFLGYVGVYLLGNRTLYSFYVITIAPSVYILTTTLTSYLGEPRIFLNAFKSYYNFLRQLFKRKSKEQKLTDTFSATQLTSVQPDNYEI